MAKITCYLKASDCTSAYTGSEISEASNFEETSTLNIASTNNNPGHTSISACIKCDWDRYDKDEFVTVNSVFTLNICSDKVTLSSSASYFGEYVFAYNVGTQVNTAIHNAFSFPSYCTFQSQKIYTYSGGVFTQYTGTDIYSDSSYNI